MVLGALRHKGRIDALLNAHLKRDIDDASPLAAGLLRIGAAQLLLLETPAHAGVGETTEAAKQMPGGARFAGLINACLRRIAETGRERFDAMEPLEDWPGWLISRWQRHYGEMATRAMVGAFGRPAPIDLTPIGPMEQLQGASSLPTGSCRLAGLEDRVEHLEGFAEGRFIIQEAAAALPVKLMGAMVGQAVIDLCAAPGGKSMQLASAGARVIAVDRHGERLDRLEENAARLGLTMEVVEADGREYMPDVPVDAVLLDAPCSATGTLRRHPDVAWHRRESDIASLVELQRALITNAVDMLKPGGQLLYATCSLEPEEGEAMIDFVATHLPRLRFEALQPEPGWALSEGAWARGTLRTRPDMWPERGGLDGFFAARFRRL
jgi:16S rRNA (cytosine967-C5)-methyltransferase